MKHSILIFGHFNILLRFPLGSYLSSKVELRRCDFYYVQALFHLDSIPEKEQLEKWINISIGGHWDADAVNYFQHNLKPRILENVDLSYDILKGRTSEEIESFFYFFFNGIHPQYVTIPAEFKELRDKDKSFYDVLLKGRKRAIQDSGH